jgi:hypothetical protein
MNELRQLDLISELYINFVRCIMYEIFINEKTIIECPHIGTVKDGGKRYYTNQLKSLLNDFLKDYYVMNNLSKWNGYNRLLKDKISTELNYESDEDKRTTEIISKNLATNSFVKTMDRMKDFLIPSKMLCEEEDDND